VLSVHVAYPMPDNRNAFSVNTGTGSAKAFLALAGVLAACAAAAPVLVCAALLGEGPLAPLVVPLGLVYGLAALLTGTHLGGDTLDRRGPELLIAVTPRR
jgi:ABC-2 type transport system permease protein